MKFAMILVIIAFALAGEASSHRAEAQDENLRRMANTLTVTGSGESNTAPDIAYVSVGVVTTGKKAQDAAQANAAATTKVVDALRRIGIAEKDVQTSGYSVNPNYEPQPRANEGPRIIGYMVSNNVRATVRKTADVGKVIDAALEAGANNVHGVSFGLDARDKAEGEALTAAVTEARRKADTLARAAGVRITGVVQLQEGAVYRPMPMMETAMFRAGARDAATPISPGELTVSANVTVVYAITSGERVEGGEQRRVVSRDSPLADLFRRHTALTFEVASLKTRYGGTHPVVRERAAELNTLDRLIEALKRRPEMSPRGPNPK